MKKLTFIIFNPYIEENLVLGLKMFASSRSLKYYFNITKRWFSSSNAVYGQALFFNKNGAPEEILE